MSSRHSSVSTGDANPSFTCYDVTMDGLRIRDLRVGGLYGWELGDPAEFFIVLQLPTEIDAVRGNRVMILSNKGGGTAHLAWMFASDEFYEVISEAG